MANTVKVTLARLAAPLQVANIKAGTTISEFLARREINYTSSIRVNGKAVSATYKLANNDIITVSTNVEGGR